MHQMTIEEEEVEKKNRTFYLEKSEGLWQIRLLLLLFIIDEEKTKKFNSVILMQSTHYAACMYISIVDCNVKMRSKNVR